jgi:hypothetical protein
VGTCAVEEEVCVDDPSTGKTRDFLFKEFIEPNADVEKNGIDEYLEEKNGFLKKETKEWGLESL